MLEKYQSCVKDNQVDQTELIYQKESIVVWAHSKDSGVQEFEFNCREGGKGCIHQNTSKEPDQWPSFFQTHSE